MELRKLDIKKELKSKVSHLGDRLSRARYFRGHGVHSPFVYAIVREVFMRSTLIEGEHRLYEELLKGGIRQKRAIQLQNLALHSGYSTFDIDGCDAELCVLTRHLSPEETLDKVQQAQHDHKTVVVLDPYQDNEREQLCRQIVREHRCTTVDNRAYLLIFNNHLPKQHFRI